MKKTLFLFSHSIHAWGGATLALLMLLVSVTGTLLVWKQDYLHLTIPQARVTFTPTPEALARIASKVEAQFNQNEILLIEFASAEFPLTKVTLSDTRYAYLDTEGVVVAQWVLNERWEEWLYDLHHRLLLGNWGLTLLGCAALAMIVLLFAGLLTFWPLRRGFSQGVLPKSTARPQLLKAHRNIGIIEAVPLLLTLVTGVTLAFPEQSQKLLLEPFRGEDYSMDFTDHLDNVSGGSSAEWLPVMQRSLNAFPNSMIRSAQTSNAFSPYRIIGLQQSGELNPQGLSKVYFDAAGGQMDIRIDAQAQHISERIINTGYPLHTGRFNNLFYKLLLTISGILIASVSVMGLFSFLKGKFLARG
ncbi:MAG: PepSY-associated TM helix domain-containing protein [Steroidobacteraceae bacterium]